ncbi:PBS lyase HEAT domain-containing protein repeat-containing protein [Halosimplex carlsbadense 2-9-1]|uniref:PBS lyase HEAT domain-containing protein repeat-containing protein n=1 Tax=Halosimplex carlsbadense 2-9-1 TaxID=797114 RepID=M0CR55_9EURY|nr:HEAT repeat domain-containing protein [Halosimplex carlsbadense]ELZ25745.1 PBS lyase HEAT domain-containing protein repeat-containing protein [Halosimplex carlsbadense 2-9-1]
MSLYQLERDGDVQELIGVMRRSDKPELRARAAELLGNFDEHDDRADVITALVSVASDDDSAAVTAAAVDSLDQLGGDAIEQLIAEMAGVDMGEGADWMKAQAFAKALDAGVPELRMAAANGLGALEETDAVPKLAERFDDPDPRVRARAARACGQIADSRATGGLEGLLTDANPKVRREAAEALGSIGNRQALSALLPLYEDGDERVRRVAVGAFGNFPNAQPVEYLVASLADDSPTVRRTAVYSLVELLANVPTQQSHEIRETVVEQLSETDDRNVVVPLVEILEESQQAAQQRNTAWLLGRVTEAEERDRVVDALVDALSADDQMTGQFAATSLAELGGDAVEDRLLALVDDTDAPTDARAQAVFTLGKVGGERARQRIDALLDETESEKIRKRAFSAISKLGGRG